MECGSIFCVPLSLVYRARCAQKEEECQNKTSVTQTAQEKCSKNWKRVAKCQKTAQCAMKNWTATCTVKTAESSDQNETHSKHKT